MAAFGRALTILCATVIFAAALILDTQALLTLGWMCLTDQLGATAALVGWLVLAAVALCFAGAPARAALGRATLRLATRAGTALFRLPNTPHAARYAAAAATGGLAVVLIIGLAVHGNAVRVRLHIPRMAMNAPVPHKLIKTTITHAITPAAVRHI